MPQPKVQKFVKQSYLPGEPEQIVLGSIAKGEYLVWSGSNVTRRRVPDRIVETRTGFQQPAYRAENDSGTVAWITRESSHQGVYTAWLDGSVLNIELIYTHDYVTDLEGIWVSDTGVVFVQESAFGGDFAPSIHSWSREGGSHTLGALPSSDNGWVVGALGNDFLWRNVFPDQILTHVPVTIVELVDYGTYYPDDGPYDAFPNWITWAAEFTMPSFAYPVIDTTLFIALDVYYPTSGWSNIGRDDGPTEFMGNVHDTGYRGPSALPGGNFLVDLPSPGSYSEQMTNYSYMLGPVLDYHYNIPVNVEFIVRQDTSGAGGGTVQLISADGSTVLSSVPVPDYVDETFRWPQTKGRITYVGIYNGGGCC